MSANTLWVSMPDGLKREVKIAAAEADKNMSEWASAALRFALMHRSEVMLLFAEFVPKMGQNNSINSTLTVKNQERKEASCE